MVVSAYAVVACGVMLWGNGRTRQNRTFPDIEVMQIACGGDDEEDRLKAELRTWTPSVDSERAIHLSGRRRKRSCGGANVWNVRSAARWKLL